MPALGQGHMLRSSVCFRVQKVLPPYLPALIAANCGKSRRNNIRLKEKRTSSFMQVINSVMHACIGYVYSAAPAELLPERAIAARTALQHAHSTLRQGRRRM
jgi:hypothetical protein